MRAGEDLLVEDCIAGADRPAGWNFRNKTLYRRLLFPVVAALVAILAGEVAIQFQMAPTFWDKTLWLLYDPYRGEGFDRIVVQQKLQNLLKFNPEVISVGDSSGFFSLQPTIVNRYMDGKKYVNLSTGANQAFDGYKANAEYALRHAPSIKYVVLYMFPQLVPATAVLRAGGLAPLLQDNLVSFRSEVMPPSAALAPYAKYKLFEGRDYRPGDALSNHKVALEFRATVDQTLGWAPEHDIRFDRLYGKLPFYSDDRRIDWMGMLPGSEPSAIVHTLTDFHRMVESYGAKLIVAFAPIPEQLIVFDDYGRKATEETMARFQREHPSVVFLFPLATTFTPDKFAQFNHIAREYVFLSSKRLGEALGKYFRDPGSVPKFVPTYVEKAPGPRPEVRATGAADDKLKEAAMAFYMYTATADPKYRSQISKQFLDLLDRDDAFRFMMEDTGKRLEILAKSNIQLGYKLDDLKGFPVEVRNVSYCDAGNPTVQWNRLSGVMNFTYSDRFNTSTEPVVWPEASNILVPTIVEDGVRKFDGYCVEPSLNPQK